MINVSVLMTTYNEADRYLHASLTWATKNFNKVYVFDDQSTDDTVDIAKSLGALVGVRRDTPSFMDCESDFKQEAWNALAQALPEGAWLMLIDADEFPLGTEGLSLQESLQRSIELAESFGKEACMVPFLEGWSMDPLQVRTDGYWAKNELPRLIKYKPAIYATKKMGCKSVPDYGYSNNLNGFVQMLHMGYADPLDRQDKYARYSSINHGHNHTHIESIPRLPTLAPCTAAVLPDIYRGVR